MFINYKIRSTILICIVRVRSKFAAERTAWGRSKMTECELDYRLIFLVKHKSINPWKYIGEVIHWRRVSRTVGTECRGLWQVYKLPSNWSHNRNSAARLEWRCQINRLEKHYAAIELVNWISREHAKAVARSKLHVARNCPIQPPQVSLNLGIVLTLRSSRIRTAEPLDCRGKRNVPPFPLKRQHLIISQPPR